MIKKLGIYFFLLSPVLVHAQNEAAIWYFGGNAGLDFNSGTPTVLTDGALFTPEGCATISDPNGSLLFYTDGITVWNRNHQPMPNGAGLLGDPSSTQSGIIVPYPGDNTLYYVFTIDDAGNSDGLQYNLVDITLDGGLGDITLKNQPLEAPVTEKLSAVAHANGSDIWVMARRSETNEFVAYLVTPTGLITDPVVSSVPAANISNLGPSGYLKFSPDGSKVVAASPGAVQLFNFDSSTGIVGNYIDITPFYAVPPPTTFFVAAYGAEFSSDSSKLYISSTLIIGSDVEYELHQFDINNYNAAAIIGSGILLSNQPVDLGALQLAIDGKIYVVQVDERYLGVIDNPNVQGLGCGYNDNAISLGSGIGLVGLPPFITTYFVVGLQARNFCHGDATEFSVNTSEPVTSITWDFGDGGTSNQENPAHSYAMPGTYTVSVTATTATETKTESKDITIYAMPSASATTDFEICTTDPSYEFDLTTKDVEVQGGLFAFELSVTYHPTKADAEAGTNVLPDLYTPSAQLETIVARLSNTNNPSCFDTTSFDLIIKEAPVLGNISDWVVCDMDTDGFFDFDLSEKDPEILDGQDPATFSISYHSSQADADGNTNAIEPNYTNTASPEPLYVRIENTAYPECFETGSFALEVITGVTANAPTPLEVCDDDNDGLFSFDLTQKDTEILGSQDPASFTVSYHGTRTDADADTDALNGSAHTNTGPYGETVFVRVQNNGNPDCYNTTILDLLVHDSPSQETVSLLQVCDDDNDGLQTVNLTAKDNEILGNQSPVDFTISYHTSQDDAEAGTNALVGTFANVSNPQTIYYRKANAAANACYVTGSFEVQVYDTPTAYAPTNFVACDDMETGVWSFDLNEKDGEVLNGQDPTAYEVLYFGNLADAVADQNALSKSGYTNAAPLETLVVRVHNPDFVSCYDLTELVLILNPLPDPGLDPFYVICPDSPELTIDGGDFETWSWEDTNGSPLGTDRNFPITELGNYTLTVSQTTNGVVCDRTIPFEVVSSGAPETIAATITGFSDNITVEVTATGSGDFEYSIDGEDFQDSRLFDVFPGEYTVYVRDIFLCRTLSTDIIALGYQKFFTPNGDGSNEHWNIIGAANFPYSQLFIFDRYGKLLSQVAPSSVGWDGTMNGTPLPESDYWFRYVYEDGKEFKGHFALKR